MGGGYYITATGTGLGKTLLTAALTWQLRQAGQAVFAIKPMASGVTTLAGSDTDALLQAQQRPPADAPQVTPWMFAPPVSPHLVAPADLHPPHIVGFCQQALALAGTTLIEGAGGAFTPLLTGYTQADLLVDLQLPAVVVCGSYVGALSHTLATIEAMQGRGIAIASVCISETPDSPTTLAQTAVSLRQHLPQGIPVFTLPWISPKTEAPLWQQLPPMTGVLGNG
jgi:dethiobiotin synthetase